MVAEPPRCPAFALARAGRCLAPTAEGAHSPWRIFAASRIRPARGVAHAGRSRALDRSAGSRAAEDQLSVHQEGLPAQLAPHQTRGSLWS